MKKQDLIFTMLFTFLWIGLVLKKEGLKLWFFQFAEPLNYILLATPVLIYTVLLLLSRYIKKKVLKRD
jgi:hypothetical protein